MKAGLTPKLADCLDAIKSLTFDGVPPTVEELRVELGLCSRGNVHDRLRELRKRGHIDWIDHTSRSLYIVANDVAYSAVAFTKLQPDKLLELIALMAGVHAHKAGGAVTAKALTNISDRLADRPRTSDHARRAIGR